MFEGRSLDSMKMLRERGNDGLAPTQASSTGGTPGARIVGARP
jgi:hypothetical protein